MVDPRSRKRSQKPSRTVNQAEEADRESRNEERETVKHSFDRTCVEVGGQEARPGAIRAPSLSKATSTTDALSVDARARALAARRTLSVASMGRGTQGAATDKLSVVLTGRRDRQSNRLAPCSPSFVRRTSCPSSLRRNRDRQTISDERSATNDQQLRIPGTDRQFVPGNSCQALIAWQDAAIRATAIRARH